MPELVKQTMDVEQMVTWALRDQGLGWGSAAQAAGWEELGTRVDTSGRWSVPAPSASLMTDDDALVVRQAIDALPPEAGALVIQYGRIGERPDWVEEGPGEYVQERDGRGRPMWDWEDPVNRTGEKRQRMKFEGLRPELVTWHRAQYTLWREALHALVAPINRVLASHQAFGPFAPERPWETYRAAVILYPVDA